MSMLFIIQRIKTLILVIIGAWRRALCCFRRRRRLSCDSIPLTAIGVVPNHLDLGNSSELVNWNNWDDGQSVEAAKPSTIQEHIQFYRQMLVAKQPVEEEENQKDFFENMTPKITRQPKIILNTDESNNENHENMLKLSLAPEPVITVDGELGEWEENAGGWEEQTQSDWNTQSILREKRLLERERRLWEQQHRKQEKAERPFALGAKIS